jgi:SAM-dependent methyltransferase
MSVEKEYINLVKIAVELVGVDAKKLKTDIYNEVRDRGNMYPLLMPNCSFLDINKKYCKIMAKRYPDAEIKEGDIRAIPYTDDTFDLVVDLSTIDHIAEYKTALREYKRILKMGGVLLLSVWVDNEQQIKRHNQYRHKYSNFNSSINNMFNIIAHDRFMRGGGWLVWYLAKKCGNT